MPSKQNQELVAQISADFEAAKSIVVADYSGLDVTAQNKLRSQLSEAGGTLQVRKNRLFKLVAQEKLGELPQDLETALNGQNSFLFGHEDAVSALKVLFDFAKDNEALEIKVGILDGKVLSFEETQALSKLPSKEELIGQLIGQIQGPIYGLVNVVQAPSRNLVYVLKAIEEKKSAD